MSCLKKAAPFCKKIVKGRKHIRVYPQDSNIVVIASSTSSDYNVVKQVGRDLKRAGIKI